MSVPPAAAGVPGTAAVTAGAAFDFAGVRIGFECRSGSWLHALGERFAGFETTAAPDFLVRYLPASPRPAANGAPGGPWPPVVARSDRGAEVEILGPAFAARVDLAGRRAEVTGPDALYPVDVLLRELLPALAGRGVVLHCALLADGAAAWACCGASGSGKSTLAGLLPQHALCDELALLGVDGRGARASALPYWTARPGGARLAGVSVLRHGDAHRRARLTPEQALRALSPEVVWPSFPDGALEASFSALAELVETVPVWALEFLPRADVWDVITAEA